MSRRLKIAISLLLLIAATFPLSGNECNPPQVAAQELSLSATTTNQFSPLVSGDWDPAELSPYNVVRLGGQE
jgi:hypothetical protein